MRAASLASGCARRHAHQDGQLQPLLHRYKLHRVDHAVTVVVRERRRAHLSPSCVSTQRPCGKLAFGSRFREACSSPRSNRPRNRPPEPRIALSSHPTAFPPAVPTALAQPTSEHQTSSPGSDSNVDSSTVPHSTTDSRSLQLCTHRLLLHTQICRTDLVTESHFQPSARRRSETASRAEMRDSCSRAGVPEPPSYCCSSDSSSSSSSS